MGWTYNDGGRAEAGFKGNARDCVARAVAIATGKPYGEVYRDIAAGMKGKGFPKSARNGVPRKVYHPYLLTSGFTWTALVTPGTGFTVWAHGEVPTGRLILRLRKHLVASIDGELYDTCDPGAKGIYGYYTLN